jgi:UDP-GlcNAc:undecaprenyl-phosphate GlcNAc-1-phosphate transferase
MLGEFQDMVKYLGVLLTALVVSYALTPMMIILGKRMGIVDVPDGEDKNNGRRVHESPTPRSGGLAVILAFNIGCLVTYFIFWPGFKGVLDMSWWSAFMWASLILVFVGLLDDKRGLSPWTKLIGQTLAASLLYYLTGKGFDKMLGFDLPWLLDYGLTLIWFLAIINAFNLIDGLDGLCSGLAVISTLGLGASFVLRGMPGDGLIVLALTGAALGFLRYNFHPAKIFLGDTGSMFFGFALASMALATSEKSALVISLGVPFIAAGVYFTLKFMIGGENQTGCEEPFETG